MSRYVEHSYERVSQLSKVLLIIPVLTILIFLFLYQFLNKNRTRPNPSENEQVVKVI